MTQFLFKKNHDFHGDDHVEHHCDPLRGSPCCLVQLAGHLSGGDVGLTAGYLQHGAVGDTLANHKVKHVRSQVGDALVQLKNNKLEVAWSAVVTFSIWGSVRLAGGSMIGDPDGLLQHFFRQGLGSFVQLDGEERSKQHISKLSSSQSSSFSHELMPDSLLAGSSSGNFSFAWTGTV